MLGRGIAHLTIYLAPLALYLIVLPRVYGFSALGNPLQLFALASVFILATSLRRNPNDDRAATHRGRERACCRHKRPAMVKSFVRVTASLRRSIRNRLSSDCLTMARVPATIRAQADAFKYNLIAPLFALNPCRTCSPHDRRRNSSHSRWRTISEN